MSFFVFYLDSLTPTTPVSASDTLAVTATEADASIRVSIFTSDTIQASLVESASAFVNVTATDAIAAGLSDSSSNIFIVDSITVADAIACAADDQTVTVLIVDSVTASDAVAIVSTDAIVSTHVHALADDAVAVQSGEATLTDVSLQAADSCATSLSADVHAVVTGACTDSIGVAVTDTAAAQDVTGQQNIAVTDALTIGIAESTSIYAELDAIDVLAAELAESAVVPLIKTAQDDLAAMLTDEGAVSAETPEDPVYWNGSIGLEYAGACAHSYQIPCAGSDRNRW